MKPVINLLLLIAAVCCGSNSAFAQTWTQTSAPNYQWTSVASSADGSKLVAAGQPYWIYTSTNSGTTWISNNIPVSNNIPDDLYDWNAVASSADGTKLVAVGGYSDIRNGQPDIHAVIFTSTNGGGIWTSNSSAPNQAWTSVASSADGNKLVIAGGVATYGAINFFTAIYTSTNAGTTWTQTSAPSNYWGGVASSADGSKLVAAAYNNPSEQLGLIYVSTNAGVAWTQTSAPSNTWTFVASSADGNKLVAVVYRGAIYTSTNSGATWISNNLPNNGLATVVSSADGSKFVARIAGIFTSTNSGATWTSNSVPNEFWSGFWDGIALSADGNEMVAVDHGTGPPYGGIWTLQTTPAPQMNVTTWNGNLTVSWIVPSTNFVLQQSSDLISWSKVANTPVLNLTNLQNQIIMSAPNNSSFYRLTTP